MEPGEKAREGGTACTKRDDACGMMSVETSAGAEVLKCDQECTRAGRVPCVWCSIQGDDLKF